MTKCDASQDSLSNTSAPRVLRRTWVVFFVSFASFLLTFLRYNLSVAIIAIQDEQVSLPSEVNGTDHVEVTKKRYALDDSAVSNLLGSYFVTYTLFQMPAGRLSELFGARHILLFGTLGSGLVTFCCPFFLELSPTAMAVGRALIGLFHASSLSCGFNLVQMWIPDSKQKSVAITWLNAAFELGGICSFLIAGFVCSSDMLGPQPWKYTFYLFALPAIAYAIPYYFLVFSRPEDDPGLTDYERRLIENERREANSEDHELSKSENMVKIPPKIKWSVILTSPPVIASCFTKCAIGMYYYLVCVKAPAYFKEIFNVSIASNGSFTALTVLGVLSCKLMCLPLSTFLLNRNPMSLTNFRKTFQTFATLIPALCLFVITLKNDDQTLATCMIFFGMFGIGFVCLGDSCATVEMARELCGSIFGITNTFACCSGIMAPMLVSALQRCFDNRVVAWNWTFAITAVFFLVCTIIFLLFGSAEPQPWAVSKFISVEEFEQNKRNKKATKSSA